MSGKGQADAVPALRARGVQVKDAERHRQPFAAIDDPHQIGILHVVVGQLVAAVAVLQQENCHSSARARAVKIADGAGIEMPPEIASQRIEVLAIARESDARALERGQRQRRLAHRQHRRVGGCKIAQVARALLQVEGIQAARSSRPRKITNSMLPQIGPAYRRPIYWVTIDCCQRRNGAAEERLRLTPRECRSSGSSPQPSIAPPPPKHCEFGLIWVKAPV